MKKAISTTTLIAYIVLIFAPIVSAQISSSLKVAKIKGKFLIANGGINQGIQAGTRYTIVRNNVTIGITIVKQVRQNISGLEIISKIEPIKPGDHLVIDESDNLLNQLNGNSFSNHFSIGPAMESPIHDYYNTGKQDADNTYSGGGAFGGGFASGFFLGIFGFGVYAIVASKGVDVPPHQLTSINNRSAKAQYEAGYKERVKQKRNGKFLSGTLVGIGTIITLVLLSSDQN